MQNNEEFDELDDLNDVLDGSLDSGYQGKLPGGLLALCILTFVGSIFILLKDAFTYQFYEVYADIGIVYLGEVLSCFGAIAGAILMILMKKAGFYIYVASNILYILSVAWFWYLIMGSLDNEWTIVILLFYIVAPIGFIVLYSTHRKYLK